MTEPGATTAGSTPAHGVTVSVGQALAAAVRLHQSGDLEQARNTYRQVLSVLPDQPDALHFLGILEHQQGRTDAAISLLERSLALRAGSAEFHNNFGKVLQDLGRVVEARDHHERAIEIDRQYGEAYINLGAAYMALDQVHKATDAYREALGLNSGHAGAHNNLGNALLADGRPEEAAAAFHSAIRLRPGFVEAEYNLGNALLRLGRPDEAASAFRRAIALNPDYAVAWAGLGSALVEPGNIEEAVAALRKAVTLRPDIAEAHSNLGGLLLDLPDSQEDAIAALRQAIVLNPDIPEPHYNLGLAHKRVGELDKSSTMLRRALDLSPESLETNVSLFECLAGACRWPEALDQLQALEPLVDGALVRGGSEVLGLVPFCFLLPYVRADHPLLARVLAGMGKAYSTGTARLAAAGSRHAAGDKLRVGYVSSNFGDHPISHVMRPVFALHDRRQFEVHCFSLQDRSDDPGPYLADIKSGTDHFVDLSRLADADAVDAIRDCGIDILVDLNGYLANCRPAIFAARPAPIQVYWTGHGGSLGAPYIDYVIGDPHVIPTSDIDAYTEKIARLPEFFAPADQAPIAECELRRGDYGLPESGIVFCAFNNPLKIDASVFTAWARILHETPDSVLWLSGGRHFADAARNLRRHAADHGIDPGRLVLAEREPGKAVHLARHALADLFLDTFNFSAATTALDALWAGLPMLTRPGRSFYSRIGASAVRALGLHDFVCKSTEEYVERAVALARDQGALAEARRELACRRHTSPLFDTARLVRHLEAAFIEMWTRHRNCRKPVSFDVPPAEANAVQSRAGRPNG